MYWSYLLYIFIFQLLLLYIYCILSTSYISAWRWDINLLH